MLLRSCFEFHGLYAFKKVRISYSFSRLIAYFKVVVVSFRMKHTLVLPERVYLIKVCVLVQNL